MCVMVLIALCAFMLFVYVVKKILGFWSLLRTGIFGFKAAQKWKSTHCEENSAICATWLLSIAKAPKPKLLPSWLCLIFQQSLSNAPTIHTTENWPSLKRPLYTLNGKGLKSSNTIAATTASLLLRTSTSTECCRPGDWRTTMVQSFLCAHCNLSCVSDVMSKQGKSEVQKGRPGNTPGNSRLDSAFNLVIFPAGIWARTIILSSWKGIYCKCNSLWIQINKAYWNFSVPDRWVGSDHMSWRCLQGWKF